MQNESIVGSPVARKKRKYTFKKSALQLARDNNNTLDRYVCYKRSLISFVPESLLLNLLQADSQLLCVANFIHSPSTKNNIEKSHISAVPIEEMEDLETVAWLHWKLHVPSLPSAKLCDCFVAACTIMSLKTSKESSNNESVADVQIAAPYIGNPIHDNEFWCCVRCVARLACRTFTIVLFHSSANTDHTMSMIDQAYRSLSGIGYWVAIKIIDESSCAIFGASALEWTSDLFDNNGEIAKCLEKEEQTQSNTVRLVRHYETCIKPLFF